VSLWFKTDVKQLEKLKNIIMIRQFQNLSWKERELLFHAPALLSVLVSCSENEVNETHRNAAIKLAHLRTFTADGILLPYYHQVEKTFNTAFEDAVNRYAPFDAMKREELKKEISKVNDVIDKLEPAYGQALKRSLEGYALHVKRSDSNVFSSVIFPFSWAAMNN
jgi:hypothetical protein